MLLYEITDSFDDQFFGPYSDPGLADVVLKIVQMAVDDGAQIVTADCDPYADQLRAGLRPFKISVDLLGSKVINTEVTLTWPPAEAEGIISQREGHVEYFVWARNQAEAKVKLARLPKRHAVNKEENAEEVM